MISIANNKELVMTKILDIIRDNPNVSQKDIVSLVTAIFDNSSEEDSKLILQTLNNLVQNKVINRNRVGRKVTYTFTTDTDENSNNLDEQINTKKLKQDVQKFILKILEKEEISKEKLVANTLKEFGITDEDKTDTSTESKYTLYKGIVGTVLAELNKSKKINLSGSKNKQVVSLIKQEVKKEKKTQKKETNNTNKIVKKEVKVTKKENFINEVVEKFDVEISNTLDKMKEEQLNVQKHFNEIQKENILNFICHSRKAHDSSIPEMIAGHIICKLYGVEIDNAVLQGGADDNGIDAIVYVKEPLGFPTKKVAVQMKCYEKADKGCTPNEISKLYGDMARLKFRKGFMITTGIFDENAIHKQFTDERGTYVHVAKYHGLNFDFGSHERMIICIDGKTLVNYMIEYRLGVLVSEDGNIVGIDREYFEKLSKSK